jgi:hypothetical protein
MAGARGNHGRQVSSRLLYFPVFSEILPVPGFSRTGSPRNGDLRLYTQRLVFLL